MRIWVRYLQSLILAMFILACNSGSDIEKKEVLGAVKTYNSMLRRTYMEANLNLMRNVATMKQIKKLFPVIQALRVSDNSMMAEQKTFTVKKISVKEKNALVETEEAWVYWWQNKDTAEITRPEKTTKYVIRYNLIKKDDFWKVDSIETIS